MKSERHRETLRGRERGIDKEGRGTTTVKLNIECDTGELEESEIEIEKEERSKKLLSQVGGASHLPLLRS